MTTDPSAEDDQAQDHQVVTITDTVSVQSTSTAITAAENAKIAAGLRSVIAIHTDR